MCGIFGILNSELSKKKLNSILNSMTKISYRGKDGCGVYFNNKVFFEKKIEDIKNNISNDSESKIVLGHLLHSIVGFVPQPIVNDDCILVSNCEIYNWEKLNKKYEISSKNDTETLLYLMNGFGNDDEILSVLDELDGTYAFAYLDSKNKRLVLTRDRLGVKPLWYYYDSESGEFEFSSEKKTFDVKKINNVCEVDPRQVLFYDLNSKKLKFVEKKFTFDMYEKEIKDSYKNIKKETKELLFASIRKRVPKGVKIGVLFSGGIDSTFIAYVLKKIGVDFTCYTAKVEGGNIQEAQDLIYAKEIAKKYGFDLKIAKISTDKLEDEVREVIKIIEDNEYLKVSVAMPFYLSCKLAKEDGVKVIFSGLGSEEIFAGYRRHRKVDIDKINLECFKGLMCMHERDLYRDDVITMSCNQELRLPFLDKNLVDYCLRIPDKYKLSSDKLTSKIILREIASEIGLAEKYALRPKQAAQYGSKFDKGLMRLAKNKGLSKQEYVKTLL